jgi:hypothetical protein
MIVEPKCFTRQCRYFLGVNDAKEPEQVVICKAFPKGIPDEIAYGDNPHTKPYLGDHDILYTQEAP